MLVTLECWIVPIETNKKVEEENFELTVHWKYVLL